MESDWIHSLHAEVTDLKRITRLLRSVLLHGALPRTKQAQTVFTLPSFPLPCAPFPCFLPAVYYQRTVAGCVFGRRHSKDERRVLELQALLRAPRESRVGVFVRPSAGTTERHQHRRPRQQCHRRLIELSPLVPQLSFQADHAAQVAKENSCVLYPKEPAARAACLMASLHRVLFLAVGLRDRRTERG